MNDDDLALALLAARNGSQRGYSVIYAGLAGSVLAFLRARDVWDPEALTNEVFYSAFRSLDSFVGDADKFRGWLFTIARNRAIDDARSRARRPVAADADIPERPAGHVDDDVFARLERQWVVDLIETLTPDQRDVLVLRLLEGHTIADIARIIDKPVDAVKALQRRALRQLKKRISGDPYPSDRPRR